MANGELLDLDTVAKLEGYTEFEFRVRPHVKTGQGDLSGTYDYTFTLNQLD